MSGNPVRYRICSFIRDLNFSKTKMSDNFFHWIVQHWFLREKDSTHGYWILQAWIHTNKWVGNISGLLELVLRRFWKNWIFVQYSVKSFVRIVKKTQRIGIESSKACIHTNKWVGNISGLFELVLRRFWKKWIFVQYSAKSFVRMCFIREINDFNCIFSF